MFLRSIFILNAFFCYHQRRFLKVVNKLILNFDGGLWTLFKKKIDLLLTRYIFL